MVSLFKLVCSNPVDIAAIESYFIQFPDRALSELNGQHNGHNVLTNHPPIFILAICSCNKDLIDLLLRKGADINAQYINPVTQESYYHPLLYLAYKLDILEHILIRFGHVLFITEDLFQQLIFSYATASYSIRDIEPVIRLILKWTPREIVRDNLFILFIYKCGQTYVCKEFLDIVDNVHPGIFNDYRLSVAADISTSYMFQKKTNTINWWEDFKTILMLFEFGFDVFTKLNIYCYTLYNIKDPEKIQEFDLGRYFLGSIDWNCLKKMNNATILKCHQKMLHADYSINIHLVAYVHRLGKICLRMFENHIRRKYHPNSSFMNDQFIKWYDECQVK